MNNSTILVVDDDRGVRKAFKRVLEEHHQLHYAKNGAAALKIFRQKHVDLVLLDIQLPDLDGLALLKHFKEIEPDSEIIMVSALTEISSAVRSIKLGAFDYLGKPFGGEALLSVVKRALESRASRKENVCQQDELKRFHSFEEMVGQSAKMKKVFSLISRVAQAQGPGAILIQGESGTGKDLVARAIHNRSRRRRMPFVVADCAAIPLTLMESELFGFSKGAFTGALENRRGKLEIAESGTLFFDDIDLLDIHMQARLLRVLQDKEYEKVGSDRVVNVDIKFIAASNRDLHQLVEKGKFREDLFYRLNVFPIELPPLRERKKDIPELLDYFLSQNGRNTGLPAKSFTKKAIQDLMEYDWPGNVRELENFVERVFIICGGTVIHQADVRPLQRYKVPRQTLNLKEAKADFEKQHIQAVLATVDGRKGKAAGILGIHRNTLSAKISGLNIEG